MQTRKADFSEYDLIHKMGYDAWGDGQGLESYLEACRNSPKYKRGTWYVLVDESADGEGSSLYSSLIRYALWEDTCGIGSIATPPRLRNQGFASRLMRDALAIFEKDGFSKAFLFSDFDPKFYQKFGFHALSDRHQKYTGSVCMVRGVSVDVLERDPSFRPPEYF